MKVYVYFNLHKKCFSVKAMDGPEKGRVIAHRKYVGLKNARPKVSEAGRQRVISEKRKNVHAGIVGEWTDVIAGCTERVSYNPYRGPCFYSVATGLDWESQADYVFMESFENKARVYKS